MGCNCAANSLVLARDSRITSERDGAPAVTWADPSTWHAVAGATAIEVFPLVLNTEGSPTLSLVAEQSLDARSFRAFDRVANACTWDLSTELTPVRIELTREEATPVFRFGLQVSGTGGVQAAVRLTLIVVVYRATQFAAQSQTAMASVSGTSTPLTDTTGGDTIADATRCANVVCMIQSASVTGNLDVELRTSDDAEAAAGDWLAVPGATLQLVASTTTKDSCGVLVSAGVLRYVRLYTTSSNGGSATNLVASVWVRA